MCVETPVKNCIVGYSLTGPSVCATQLTQVNPVDWSLCLFCLHLRRPHLHRYVDERCRQRYVRQRHRLDAELQACL